MLILYIFIFPINKRQRKPKGQSRMNNPERLATLVTQDTGRRQHGPHKKTGVNSGDREG